MEDSPVRHLITPFLPRPSFASLCRQYLGTAGLYLLFLGGGVLSALDKSFHEFHLRRQTRRQLEVPAPLQRVLWFDSQAAADRMSRWFADSLRPYQRFVGCSSGVTA